MSQTSRPIQVENIATFRRNQSPLDLLAIPELSQKRKLTHSPFLIIFATCIVILLATMIYTLCYTDIQRVTHGYDSCGNVCGKKNSHIDGVQCSGQDMSQKPYLYNGTCVKMCSSHINENKFNYRCDQDYENIAETVQEEGTQLTILCFIGLGLSILALLLFRYFVDVFVWTMLSLSILVMFGISGLFWYLYSHAPSERSTSLLSGAILFTFFSVIFALFILILQTQIKLIIRFYEETIKIVFAMPVILLEPVLTILSNFVVVGLFAYTFVLMSYSGKLHKTFKSSYYPYPDNSNVYYDYVQDGGMIFAMTWSVIMMLWTVQFVLACQQMVISGAVASYYFARDKLTLVSPIYSSFYNLIRYHLGTVAFGSLIITVITILKIIVRALSRNNGCWRLVYICCLRPLEDLLKYMTSMGYIETAIHGEPLCRSSIRAINLIVSNFLSAVAMNSIGNFVFFMVKLLVVGVTVLIALALKVSVITVVIGGIVAFLCIHCFFVVFEIAVDTVFICYCEDNCINNGTNQPYYATLEFYNQIKKAQALTRSIEAKKK